VSCGVVNRSGLARSCHRAPLLQTVYRLKIDILVNFNQRLGCSLVQ
jgi:hypothetical protein